MGVYLISRTSGPGGFANSNRLNGALVRASSPDEALQRVRDAAAGGAQYPDEHFEACRIDDLTVDELIWIHGHGAVTDNNRLPGG